MGGQSDLREIGWGLDLSGPEEETSGSSCEHVNKPSGSLKGGWQIS
jgi:hypothetical protein